MLVIKGRICSHFYHLFVVVTFIVIVYCSQTGRLQTAAECVLAAYRLSQRLSMLVCLVVF